MPPQPDISGKHTVLKVLLILILVVAIRGCAKTVEQMRNERDVEGLIEALKSTDSEKRAKAAEALGELRDVRAIEPLIEALSDEDSTVRQKASEALAKIGTSATKSLVEALKSDDWRVRYRAAWAIGKIGDARAVPYLIQAVDDEVRDVRLNIVWAFGEIGVDPRAVDPIFNALKDEDSSVREEAKNALVKMGEQAVDKLIQALNDKDSEIRNISAWALVEIGGRRGTSFETRKKMAEPLVNALRDEDEDVRLTVALSLDKLHFTPRNEEENAWYLVAKREWNRVTFVGNPAIEPLILALKGNNSDVKWGATKALVKTGSSAVDPLIQALEDESAQIQAAIALEIIGTEKAKNAVNGFIDEYNADLEYISKNYDEILNQVNISGYEFLLVLALEIWEQ